MIIGEGISLSFELVNFRKSSEKREGNNIPPNGEIHISDDLFTYLSYSLYLEPGDRCVIPVNKPTGRNIEELLRFDTLEFAPRSQLGQVGIRDVKIIGSDKSFLYLDFENGGDYNLVFDETEFMKIGRLYACGLQSLIGSTLRDQSNRIQAKKEDWVVGGQHIGWKLPIATHFERWDQIPGYDIESVYTHPESNVTLHITQLAAGTERRRLRSQLKLTDTTGFPKKRGWRRPTEIVQTLPVVLFPGLALVVCDTEHDEHGPARIIFGNETDHEIIGEYQYPPEKRSAPLPEYLHVKAYKEVKYV